MSDIRKISLKERLEAIGTDKFNTLTVFDLIAEDYFNEIAKITGDECYRTMYNTEVLSKERLNNQKLFLCELVTLANRMDKKDEADFLYRTLIEPFAIMKD